MSRTVSIVGSRSALAIAAALGATGEAIGGSYLEGASTTAPDLEVYLDDAIMRVNDAFNLETISRHTVIDRKPVPPPTVTRQQLRAKQRTEDAYWNARRKEVAQMERQMRLAKVKRNKETTKARLAEISQPSILSR